MSQVLQVEMAETSDAVSLKHINDITECPICNEMFTDPRVLPCVHTFCFECIMKWAEDQARGSRLACPLCRKEHEIPGDETVSGMQRFTNLPKNYFVEKVVAARKLSHALNGTDMRCDVCCGDSDDLEEETGAAKKDLVYCVECCQKICEQCSVYHGKLKTTSQHKLVELHGKQLSHRELSVELPEDKCDKHEDKALVLYCHDCKLPTCPMCLAAKHKLHNFAGIKEVAEEARVQMKADIARIAAKIDEYRQLLAKILNNNPADFDKNINATAKIVTETAEKMKRAIDDYTIKLLDELESERLRCQKKVESVCQELEANMQMLQIFKHNSEQVENKGTPCDLAVSAAHLHDRANELIGHKICGGVPVGCLLNVKFSSEFSSGQLHSLFGELCIESESSANSNTDTNLLTPAELLLGVIPGRRDQAVIGITSLDSHVFVLRQDAQNIDVYDVVTLKLQRSFPTGLHESDLNCSLAACNRHRCVYLSNRYPSFVYRFDLLNNLKNCWVTGNAPCGISVNREANLLVTCRNSRMIQEFTTSGRLIREISLQVDTTSFPIHTVQLSGDQFGVIFTGALHRFCMIDSDGHIVRSYGGPPGSCDGMLHLPQSVALSGNCDVVFVADKQNHRVLMLNTMTLTATEVNVKTDRKAGGRLKFPFSVHYEQSRGRLYIGERGGQCRVLVVAVAE